MKCTIHNNRHAAFSLHGNSYCTECYNGMTNAGKPEAEKVEFAPWEADCTSVMDALGIKPNIENVDICADQALQHIAALKYIATELAAHGDCHCEKYGKQEANKRDKTSVCPYCLACKLTDISGLSFSDSDENHLIDFLDTK